MIIGEIMDRRLNDATLKKADKWPNVAHRSFICYTKTTKQCHYAHIRTNINEKRWKKLLIIV